jgi:hypothetical protein
MIRSAKPTVGLADDANAHANRIVTQADVATQTCERLVGMRIIAMPKHRAGMIH